MAQDSARNGPSISFLRDYAETRGFSLGRPVNPKPTPDGKAVLFLRARPRLARMALYEYDAAFGRTREILEPEQLLKGAAEKLSPEEKARRERMRVSVGGLTSFQLSEDGQKVLAGLSGKLYLLDRKDGSVRQLNTGPGSVLDPKFSPDGGSVAYVRHDDVYVLDLAARRQRRITLGGSEQVSHGLAEFVAQEEMDRYTGYWWSPDSSWIAYEEADASGVEVWYVADPAQPGQAPHPSFYPRPGRANVKVRLGVAPASGSGHTTWIQWDQARYPYLTHVDWDKRGGLTVAVQSRDQKQLALLDADPKRGSTSILLVERDSVWLNLDQQMPKWLGDGSGFLWTSERPGGWQLELRGRDGRLRWVIVPPEAGYQGLVDLDDAAFKVVYRASADPTQSQLFEVSLDGHGTRAMTKEIGRHSAVYSKDHSIYVSQTVTPEFMPRSFVCRADGVPLGELPSVAENPPFRPMAEILRVGDGEGFYAEVIRPREFDPAKRYPVIDDVYGGPRANVVLAAMGGALLKQWLADQGFIVVAMDGRGTPGRGRAWERAIAKRFGSVPLEDQAAALKALGKQFPEMDLDRVGIVGWSFGGYMSALAALKRPDLFKAAVAGAPVTDWLDYDTHYTERYLGLPEENAWAYRESSLLTYAGNLHRPLLLVHGTSDDNVYFRHSLKLAEALFRAGKDFNFLPLSGFTHMVPEPIVTERLWSRVGRYFQKNLGQPRQRPPAR